MFSRLDWMTITPRIIVDMGCGVGNMSARLQTRYGDANVLALDLSLPMVQLARQESPHIAHVCADAGILPLAHQSVDLIFANFLLPWHADFSALGREWRRVLRPGGILMFTALGPDSFKEWRTLFSQDDLPTLIDMHDIGDLLLQEGFADPVLDINYYTMTYRAQAHLFHELRASGMLVPGSKQPIDAIAPSEDGTWPVTYEVIYAHAFAPADHVEVSASPDGIVRVPLAHLRRKLTTE